jgi:hypothetical protein
MSRLPKIDHAFVRAMLHRSWLPCAIWSLLLFIGTALLRLLLPDALCLPIPSGLSLGCLLSKPLSFSHFSPQRRCLSFLSTSHHLQPSDPEIRSFDFSWSSLSFFADTRLFFSLSLPPFWFPFPRLFSLTFLSCQHSQALPVQPNGSPLACV